MEGQYEYNFGREKKESRKKKMLIDMQQNANRVISINTVSTGDILGPIILCVFVGGCPVHEIMFSSFLASMH